MAILGDILGSAEGQAAPAVDQGSLPTTVVVNEAVLQRVFAKDAAALLAAVERFARDRHGEVVRVGSENSPGVIKGRIAALTLRPERLVLLGAGDSIPAFKVKAQKLEFETDYFYGDLDGDGLAEAAVSRILGSPQAMIGQLGAAPVTGAQHALLLGDEPRLHLEMNRVADVLGELGCSLGVHRWGDPTMLAQADVIVHDLQGDSNHWHGGVNSTIVTAATVPELKRRPVVLAFNCPTGGTGSAIVRAFLEKGSRVYVGSATEPNRSMPALYANELVLYFFNALEARRQASVAELAAAALGQYIRNKDLAALLLRVEKGESPKISDSQQIQLATGLQYQVFGDVTAAFPHAPPRPAFKKSPLTAGAPANLKAGDSLRVKFDIGTGDGVPVLAFTSVWDKEVSPGLEIEIAQNGKMVHKLDWKKHLERSDFIDATTGSFGEGNRFQGRALAPLYRREGANEAVVTVTKTPKPILVQGDSVLQIWPKRKPPRAAPPQTVHRQGINLLLLSRNDSLDPLREALVTVNSLQFDFHSSLGDHLDPFEFPDERGRFVDLARYDVILVDELPRGYKTLPRGFDERIRQYVEHGGGLIMCGGWYAFGGHTGLGGYGGTPIEAILPVQIVSADDAVNEKTAAAPVTMRHPIGAGLDWSHLPSFNGYNKVAARPGVDVLVRTQAGDPLLVVGVHREGRTAAWTAGFGRGWGSEFVKWPYYSRFWGNLIRWVGRKEEKSK